MTFRDASQKQTKHRSVLWRVLPYLRPYRGQQILTTVLAMVVTLAGIALPVLTKRIIDGPLADGHRGALISLGLLALAFGLVEASLDLIRRRCQALGSLGIETDLRDELYEHLQRLPIAFHSQWKSGQLLARATSDLSAIRRFMGFGIIFLIVNGLTFLSVSCVLLFIYWPLGLLVLLSGIPLIIFSSHYERIYRRHSRAVRDQIGDLATEVEESALGIRTIKSFGRRNLFFRRFNDKAIELQRRELAKINTLAKLWAGLDTHPPLVLGFIVLVGAAATAHHILTLGTLVAFISLFLLLKWPIESMGWIVATAREAVSAAERLFEVLDIEPTITDKPGATPLATAVGRVTFDNVTFHYPDGTTPALRNINLDISPGETVAIVGATGCGKTTLTALVNRLFDPSGGRVLLDGHDIRDLPLADLRRWVSVGFEEATLFSASVKENLLLGRPHATEEEIAEALEIAQAGFVYDLPWGLKTRVGEQGLRLSGGQRQRLALARAVIGRPRVLVLDDPLSALDVHTEALVEEALRRVLATSTAIVVAHRPSTVLLADTAVLMEDGEIVARGNHHDLLESVPSYRDILSQKSDLEVTP